MRSKQDYSTCVWNNKPLSKDDDRCAPLQANKLDFQDLSHQYIKMFRGH